MDASCCSHKGFEQVVVLLHVNEEQAEELRRSVLRLIRQLDKI